MTDSKFDFWINNNLNVLFTGKAGCGKTARVIEAFNRNKLKWKYFSASTLDPWVDMIGVPREIKDEDSGKSYLDLIRPKWFAEDEVEAIFLDEYNRCLTGDTKVLSPDGNSYSLKELVKKESFYTYSYDTKTKKVVIGKGHSSRITIKNAKIIKVNIDNGTSVRCTEDHPFLLKTGVYKFAKDLTPNDSLMPLYKIWNKNGYEKIYQPTSIEDAGHEDVYDITVDDYHNFAIENGVFVHNSPAKVRNATMELIQFKSINGKKFNNLRFVWAAINPEKDITDDSAPEYDVEKLDPAQKDRFEVHIDVPYKPDIAYFKNKFGADIGKTGINWWQDLTDKEKDIVSPRRLDYCLEIYTKGGDPRDVLPKQVNVSKLVTELKNGNFRDKMEKIFETRDYTQAELFMKDENSYNNTIKYIVGNKNMIEFFFTAIPEEKQSNLVSTDDNVLKYAINNMDLHEKIVKRAAIANTKVSKALEKHIKLKPLETNNFEKFTFSSIKLEFQRPPMRLDNEGTPLTDTINNEIPNINNGTAYRKRMFKIIISSLYFDRGYNTPKKPTDPLTEPEIVLILDVLNTLIDKTYTPDNFKELPQVYGLVCREYLTRYGKKQNYKSLDKRIQDFLNLHGNMYL
jgi:hypothetical protein